MQDKVLFKKPPKPLSGISELTSIMLARLKATLVTQSPLLVSPVFLKLFWLLRTTLSPVPQPSSTLTQRVRKGVTVRLVRELTAVLYQLTSLATELGPSGLRSPGQTTPCAELVSTPSGTVAQTPTPLLSKPILPHEITIFPLISVPMMSSYWTMMTLRSRSFWCSLQTMPALCVQISRFSPPI